MAEKEKQSAEQQANEAEQKVEHKAEHEAEKENTQKHKKKKEDETAKLKAELEKEHDMLLRTAAEFDNYKKRTEREKLSVGEFVKADLIKKLLPIIDNIDRAGEADLQNPDYIKGIEMIIKQFSALKETLAITPIAAVGDTFDPALHEAVMHTEDENLGENTVAQVLQQGYKTGDTVIRTAMVSVAN